MFNLLAHAGHSHDASTAGYASFIDHCTPVIVIASLIVAFLLVVIAYLLVTWQPKSFTASKKAISSSKKKSTKK